MLNELGQAFSFFHSMRLLCLLSLFCLFPVLTVEHLVSQNCCVLVDLPQLIELSRLLFLVEDELRLLLELLLQDFNLLSQLGSVLTALIVLKHLSVDPLQLICLSINLTLEARPLKELTGVFIVYFDGGFRLNQQHVWLVFANFELDVAAIFIARLFVELPFEAKLHLLLLLIPHKL